MEKRKVGVITQKTIDLLELEGIEAGTEIYIGETNIRHMRDDHPEDHEKYFDQLEDIIANPDFVAKHPQHGSPQYIKVFEGHVMVAVRISQRGTWFTRTLFTMSEEKVIKYKNSGYMKPY